MTYTVHYAKDRQYDIERNYSSAAHSVRNEVSIGKKIASERYHAQHIHRNIFCKESKVLIYSHNISNLYQ